METPVNISVPLIDEQISRLHAGDRVLLTGAVYGARDAIHKRFIELLDANRALPVPLRNEVIFYVGPTPAPPDRATGAVGPTTSSRMDAYTPRLLDEGLKGTIGKGPRNSELRYVYAQHRAVHFAATGGAAALLSRSVTRCELVAYPELGPEALMRLQFDRLPAVVAIDTEGHDLYALGRERYEFSAAHRS